VYVPTIESGEFKYNYTYTCFPDMDEYRDKMYTSSGTVPPGIAFLLLCVIIAVVIIVIVTILSVVLWKRHRQMSKEK
jgi:hypothetical protein